MIGDWRNDQSNISAAQPQLIPLPCSQRQRSNLVGIKAMSHQTSRRKRALAAAPPPPVIYPADRLSSLPDEILAQILSFLPAQEAVRTCVLARAWRDVWKFTGRLLIDGGSARVRGFVDLLLRLRRIGLKNAAPLDECQLMFYMYDYYDVPVNRWIRRALNFRIQALRVLNTNKGQEQRHYFRMSDRHLVSGHLTRLELSHVLFKGSSIYLNLDGCPALEHLEIRSCLLLGVRKIMSLSLKHLVITGCTSKGDPERFGISAPRLVSLWLQVEAFRVPLVESMPELVEAHVRISFLAGDNCYCDDRMACYHVMPQDGYFSEDTEDDDSGNEEDTDDDPGPNTEGCVLLEGLAQAKDLVLLASRSTYIFRRDLRLCPTFSNLKTLVMNGNYWCEPADCRALAWILELAPVLENLTVVFSCSVYSYKVELKYDIVLEGRPDATANSTMTTQCIKTVKVKCHTVHEGVLNVLKFLSTLNICKTLIKVFRDLTSQREIISFNWLENVFGIVPLNFLVTIFSEKNEDFTC